MTEQAQPVPKPIPQADDASRPFFDGARRGVLMVQRCTVCKTYLAPGSPVCTECLSDVLEWVPASGRGTLFTFGIMHQRYHPGFDNDIPFNIAVVELEEGPRLNTNIVGAKNSELRIGMSVVVTFEAAGENVYLPKFRPA
ncbi:MAG: OB-fold domain-containing protein [Chloroflexi bacterium]|nr:OB-fold domain-containing protein [Chloroflexota bacterium]